MMDRHLFTRIGSLIILTASLCAPVTASSSTNFTSQVRFQHLSPKHGLSNSGVYCFYQDSRGFMWIGTEDGLNRYDGSEFRVFHHRADDPKSISHNEVWSIVEDSRGNMWIGTWGGGLNKYDRLTETFTSFRHDRSNPHSLSHDLVSQLAIDQNDILWVGTYGGGLNRFDPKTKRFEHYRYRQGDSSSIGHNDVWPVLVDRNGHIWIGTIGGGLNRLDPITGRISQYRHQVNDANSLLSDNVWSIYEDRQGVLWVGTDKGLSRLDRHLNIFQHYVHDSKDSHSISQNNIWSILEDERGGIWLGSWGSGLNYFDPSKEGFTHYSYNRNDMHSLSSDVVTMIYQDRRQALWIGTFRNGINRYDPYAQNFSHIAIVGGQAELAGSENNVTSFYESSSGLIWVGTAHGLHEYDPKSRLIRKGILEYPELSLLQNDHVSAIHETRDNAIWIGTYGKGLYRFTRSDKSLKHFLQDGEDDNSISSNYILSLASDGEGILWVGTSDGGLNRYDRVREEFVRYKHETHDPTSLANNYIYDIYEDTFGALWIGTSGGGLNRYIPGGGFKHYLAEATNSSGLSDNNVNVIYEDVEGTLMVGTAGGLNRYERSEEKFVRYDVDELSHVAINGIIKDNSNEFWISTNRGLLRYDPSSQAVKIYDVDSGLHCNEYNIGAALLAQDGKIYFGCNGGFTVFRPELLQENPTAPRIAITAFEVFNDSTTGDRNKALRGDISETGKVILPYQEADFRVTFSALNFTYPKKNQYAYLLEGFDTRWHLVNSASRTATYTNLSPGHYVFRVRASNNDGVWNKEGASIQITIKPPWWKTDIVKGVLFVAVILLLIALLRWRVRIIKEYHERRTREDILRLASQVAHDIRSPLSSMQAAITYLQEEIGRNPKHADYINLLGLSAKRLTGIADGLLKKHGGEESSRIVFSLHAILDELFGELVAQPVNQAVDFVKRYHGHAIELVGDRARLQRAFGNVVKNAIEAMDGQGRIVAEIGVEGEMAVVSISDTGPGMDEGTLKKVLRGGFSEGKQDGHGIGMTVVREVTEEFGGTLEGESNLGKGTSFIFRLPLPLSIDVTDLDREKEAVRHYHLEVAQGEPVVIVDDEPSMREQWRLILKESGVDSILCESYEELESKGLDSSISKTAVVDYHFANSAKTGGDVIRLLRSRGFERITFCTAEYWRPLVQDLVKKFGVDLCPKPLPNVSVSYSERSEESPALQDISGTQNGSGPTVLVVDDDEGIRLSWSLVKGKMGIERLDAFESMEACEEKRPDYTVYTHAFIDKNVEGSSWGIAKTIEYLKAQGVDKVIVASGEERGSLERDPECSAADGISSEKIPGSLQAFG